MRWHDVLWAIGRVTTADPILAGIYGEAIRLSGTQEHTVPSLEYFIVSSTGSELWEPCTIQFDQWCDSLLPDLAVSEAALTSLFDHATPITLEGVVMWAQLEEATELTVPDRAGFYGRAVRFRFTPLRGCLRG